MTLSNLTSTLLAQEHARTSARPTLRFDKTSFLSTDRVFFWVGVSAADDPIPHDLRETQRVIVTRPDGTEKIDHVSWPAAGPNDHGGFFGGWGLGSEPIQTGRYLVVGEFACQLNRSTQHKHQIVLPEFETLAFDVVVR